jgi:hypothetical protein
MCFLLAWLAHHRVMLLPMINFAITSSPISSPRHPYLIILFFLFQKFARLSLFFGSWGDWNDGRAIFFLTIDVIPIQNPQQNYK